MHANPDWDSVSGATAAPRYDTRALQAADSAHYLHPATDHKALAEIGARIVVRGDGIYVWDSEGNRILDAMSGLWCVNVGYGRRELADAAYRQLVTLPFYNSFFNTSNVPAITLAATLARISPPGFNHVFFAGSGSEGNDTIVRMVRRYWDLQGQPQRKVIISRRNAYHGSTMAGASLGGMDAMHAQGDLPIPNITHIEQPYHFENGGHLPADEYGLMAARRLEEKILELGAGRVAAFIGEPVQGAGGVIIPPATYWPEIQRICDRHGILLVSDEVICGFGRLGHWFGCQQMGTRPDLITFAKGVTSGYIPLGGVLVGDRVAKALIDSGEEFSHGFTYSGHPVACAVGIENIAIIERERLVERVRDDVGPYLKQHFEALQDHPLVGQAQACGLMAALVLVKSKRPVERFAEDLKVGMVCRGHMFGNGIVMRAVGDRMIIAPPLVITRAQVDEMIALIRRCLDLTLGDVKSRGWM
ncbi:MAG TPA: aspartate aminotransferase family protein [Burkholderiaceae bacterium]|jgi:putrescine aminotransferase|nr:aspartate aminotransferase family protein [Burkholderiaceae bacterium]